MSVIEITTSKKPDETFTVEVFYSDRTVSYDNVRGFDVSDDNTGAVLMFSDTHVDLTYLHGFRSLSVTSDTKTPTSMYSEDETRH